MRALPIAAATFLLTASASSIQPQTAERRHVPAPLFASTTVLHATLEAPMADLFANGRTEDEYRVRGRIIVAEAAGGRLAPIDNVIVTTRGHTSLRESECEFPKVKLDFAEARVDGTIFAGMASVKLGTHCGDNPDGPSGKYGRWRNQKAAHREAFVYRLLDVLEVPALKARPGRMTYVDPAARAGGAAQPLVRDVMFLEDDDEALERYGARGEIPPNQFGSAPSIFAMEDIAKLAFAEALIGNFDWCLRMSPTDTYRCNDTTPIWNVLGAIMPGGTAVPIIHDFDIAGMVTTRHPWFGKVFTHAFGAHQPEVEVLAQVQRTRSLFPRDVLDATRRSFTTRKAAAYQALADSPNDEDGRAAARQYLDAFYAAIETDQSFYRPVIVVRTPVFLDAAGARPACDEEALPGTPAGPALETAGGKSRVVLLDALWQWSEKCEPVRLNPVWVPTDAISSRYPQ